jgi:hypothetical protein
MHLHVFLDVLPSVHTRATLFDCWKQVVEAGYPQTRPTPSKDTGAVPTESPAVTPGIFSGYSGIYLTFEIGFGNRF